MRTISVALVAALLSASNPALSASGPPHDRTEEGAVSVRVQRHLTPSIRELGVVHPATRWVELAQADAEVDPSARLRALQAERDGIKTTVPAVFTVVGGILFLAGGIASIVMAADDDCKDSKEEFACLGRGIGLTIAIPVLVVGTIVGGGGAIVWHKRVRQRRRLDGQIEALGGEQASGRPELQIGLAPNGEGARLALRIPF